METKVKNFFWGVQKIGKNYFLVQKNTILCVYYSKNTL